MRTSFDDILEECIRRLEASGGDIEAALSRYPEQADELRPHLQVWASLSAVEKQEATPQDTTQGRQQLLDAVATVEGKEGGKELMEKLSAKGGVGLRLIGVAAVVAAIALGITFFTGNLHVEFGSEAEAVGIFECLDQALGDVTAPTDEFTFTDLTVLRQQFVAGDIGIVEVLGRIQILKTCLAGLFP